MLTLSFGKRKHKITQFSLSRNGGKNLCVVLGKINAGVRERRPWDSVAGEGARQDRTAGVDSRGGPPGFSWPVTSLYRWRVFVAQGCLYKE